MFSLVKVTFDKIKKPNSEPLWKLYKITEKPLFWYLFQKKKKIKYIWEHTFFFKKNRFNEAKSYLELRKCWLSIFSLRSLNIKRWKCGLVALGSSLYAIGGMDSPKAGHWGNPLKTVERYDPHIDKWTEVAQMNEARFGSAVVTYQVR